MPTTDDKIIELLNKIDSVKPQESLYDASPKMKKDAQKSVSEKLGHQKPKHRTLLLVLVFMLSISSFMLLATIIGIMMWQRIDNPDYVGVSDFVINTVTVGVFGQVIAIVGVISKYVFKDPA